MERIPLKTKEEIAHMRESGARLAEVLRIVGERAVPGVSTGELNELCDRLIREREGDTPAFYLYKPMGASRPFPASSCISVNDEVVHGIPNEDPRILKDGDIVAIDAGLTRAGLIVDSTITVGAGMVDARGQRLIEVTKEALRLAIEATQPGNRTGDIAHAIESYVTSEGFTLPWEFGGHGLGHSLHEPPFISNVGRKKTGAPLTVGMVIAIEPIVTEGSPEVKRGSDGYTYLTKDGKRSAQFEHTVAITENGPWVLTEE